MGFDVPMSDMLGMKKSYCIYSLNKDFMNICWCEDKLVEENIGLGGFVEVSLEYKSHWVEDSLLTVIVLKEDLINVEDIGMRRS